MEKSKDIQRFMISCIVGTMDRTDNLIKILPSWSEVSYIKEIIICDWSSKEPIYQNLYIRELINKYNKIKIIRIDGQIYYYRCLALNLAYQFTNKLNPYLLKIDADYLNLRCDNAFFDSISRMNLLDDNYFHGEAYTPEYGFLFIKRFFFEKLNGYNEYFESAWGFEDVDFYRRLTKKFNLRPMQIGEGELISHIPHDNKLRLVNQEFNRRDYNIKISEKEKQWDMQKYEIVDQAKFYIKVKKRQ